jgi:hypothetical protein
MTTAFLFVLWRATLDFRSTETLLGGYCMLGFGCITIPLAKHQCLTGTYQHTTGAWQSLRRRPWQEPKLSLDREWIQDSSC